MHGGDVYINKEQGYDFPTRWYVRLILRKTLHLADGLTAISDDCSIHALAAGAKDSNMQIIMNGADLRRFSPGLESCSKYGEQMVFACRQLVPRKGIRFLIMAAGELKAEFPELQTVIAGDGMERPELEQLTAELGLFDRVHLIGWVPNDELPSYYRSSIFSVIPSLEEGFGIPAAEAMGCGIPVIATDAGGLPEVVEDGVTGYVVPKGDARALSAAMRKLLQDAALRRQMGRAGRKRALAQFDWLITAKSMENMYRNILEQRKGSRS
jgi:glycosyltransferase involved in cell wall biosynthesis